MSHREMAEKLIRFACLNAAPGRLFDDPVYKAVVEGRQEETATYIRKWEATPAAQRKGPRPFYSSCGDLAHWLLFRLGVRFPWINRDEHDGWNFQGADNNVTTITCRPIGSNKIARPVGSNMRFFAGDILVVGTASPGTTHVSCVIEHVPEMDLLVTGDYGQPHGAIRDTPVDIVGGKLRRGKRMIDSVLVLDEVIEAAHIAGVLQPPESVDDYQQRFTFLTTRRTP